MLGYMYTCVCTQVCVHLHVFLYTNTYMHVHRGVCIYMLVF